MDVKKGHSMPTIANVIPFPSQPDPSPGSIAIAEGILDAGYGPEKIPWVVEGFRHAAELEQEITTAMAALQSVPARAPFPVMTPAETEEFWAAVEMLRAGRALREASAAGSAAILAAVPS